jgi:catechol 2,3-dioxygenase-like lactoylglutathione lyase family enzyme
MMSVSDRVFEPGIAIPILPARDLGETRRFYEALGFRATGWWPKEFGGYAILVRGDLSMHFFKYGDLSPTENYAKCYWRVKAASIRDVWTEPQPLIRIQRIETNCIPRHQDRVTARSHSLGFVEFVCGVCRF